jgi:hypothetical protein
VAEWAFGRGFFWILPLKWGYLFLKWPVPSAVNTTELLSLEAFHLAWWIIYLHSPGEYLYLSIDLSIYLSVCLFDLSIYLFLYPSIFLFTHLSIHPSIYLFVYLPVRLYIHPSIDPFIHLSIHLSICPSIHLTIYRSIHLSIYAFISLSRAWYA